MEKRRREEEGRGRGNEMRMSCMQEKGLKKIYLRTNITIKKMGLTSDINVCFGIYWKESIIFYFKFPMSPASQFSISCFIAAVDL